MIGLKKRRFFQEIQLLNTKLLCMWIEAGRKAVDVLVKLENERPRGVIQTIIKPELAIRKSTLNTINKGQIK